MIGRTLSHFKITAKLGEGGMGVVYRATDTRLDREVAIKVLPEAFIADAERLARFEREAKLLASLNHPRIAAIYGMEKVDGEFFLILEMVEGETLAQRIRKGPIPARRALDFAYQIGEGLEAAHDQGIVHRDLKPANVKVTPDGQVKILDFGLAKMILPELTGIELAESPTLTGGMTRAGVLLGTAAYMSPEQARGKEASRQADIWAFGALLYELLTGQRAFPGETGTDVLAAIVGREPDWDALPQSTPRVVRSLLRRCLKKDPAARLRDVGDARLEIGEALSEDGSESATGLAAASTSVTTRRWRLIGVLTAAAVALAISVWQLLPEERVVYLIDTAAPVGVYDPHTRDQGRTNADDLSDALGDLPITLVKEATSPWWRREHQVLMQRPALVVIHLSAFAYPPSMETIEDLRTARTEVGKLGVDDPIELGRDRLIAFLAYIALGSPETQFVVYSRGHFQDEADRLSWISAAETRFPQLKGRIFAYDVPGEFGTETFSDPATGEEVKRLVESILGLE